MMYVTHTVATEVVGGWRRRLRRGLVSANLPDVLAVGDGGAFARLSLGLESDDPSLLDHLHQSGPALTDGLRGRRTQAVEAFSPLLQARKARNELRRLALVCARDEHRLEVFHTPGSGLVVVANVLQIVARTGTGATPEVDRLRHLRWQLVDLLALPTSIQGAPDLIPAMCRCNPGRTVSVEHVLHELRQADRTRKRRVVLS